MFDFDSLILKNGNNSFVFEKDKENIVFGLKKGEYVYDVMGFIKDDKVEITKDYKAKMNSQIFKTEKVIKYDYMSKNSNARKIGSKKNYFKVELLEVTKK